jgi:hypothetical protein
VAKTFYNTGSLQTGSHLNTFPKWATNIWANVRKLEEKYSKLKRNIQRNIWVNCSKIGRKIFKI